MQSQYTKCTNLKPKYPESLCILPLDKAPKMRAPRGQSGRAEFSLYHTLCTFVKLNVAQIFNLNDPEFCATFYKIMLDF
jgi:hypothetical protein